MQLHVRNLKECQELGAWISQWTALNPFSPFPCVIKQIQSEKHQCPQDTKCWDVQYANTSGTQTLRFQVQRIKEKAKKILTVLVCMWRAQQACTLWQQRNVSSCTSGWPMQKQPHVVRSVLLAYTYGGRGALHMAATVGHGIWWELQHGWTGRDSHLAMYTFVVGPWFPQTSVISSGLKHKPGKTGTEYLWKMQRQRSSCFIVSCVTVDLIFDEQIQIVLSKTWIYSIPSKMRRMHF